jgi:hypothetical protein
MYKKLYILRYEYVNLFDYMIRGPEAGVLKKLSLAGLA